MTEDKNSMPLSVLVAICAEINQHKPAQMEASREWIDMEPGFARLLWKAAERIPDEATRDWIYNEFYGAARPSEPPPIR